MSLKRSEASVDPGTPPAVGPFVTVGSPNREAFRSSFVNIRFFRGSMSVPQRCIHLAFIEVKIYIRFYCNDSVTLKCTCECTCKVPLQLDRYTFVIGIWFSRPAKQGPALPARAPRCEYRGRFAWPRLPMPREGPFADLCAPPRRPFVLNLRPLPAGVPLCRLGRLFATTTPPLCPQRPVCPQNPALGVEKCPFANAGA